MPLFVAQHRHPPETCSAVLTGSGLLSRVSAAAAARHAVSIEAEALIDEEHRLVVIVEAANRRAVKDECYPRRRSRKPPNAEVAAPSPFLKESGERNPRRAPACRKGGNPMMNRRLFGKNRVQRLALFAVVIAVAAGISATASAGDNRNQTPGCQTSAWDFKLTGDFGTQGYLLNPVERCRPTASRTGTWTLSGVVFVTDASGLIQDGCMATVSGTLRETDFSADWSWDDLCTGQVTSFTGTLKWGTTTHPTTGSGSGTWTDNFAGSGTWTADRLS